MASEIEDSGKLGVITCNVMDTIYDENAKPVPLSNHCYPSDTSTVALEPERTAPYRCRWIHLSYNYGIGVDEFLEIVEDVLRTRDDEERKKIITALRKFKRHNELGGMNGSSFRPGFYPLFADEWHENLLDCLTPTGLDSNQPIFVTVPTLHVGASGLRLRKNSKDRYSPAMHYPKSLLEYHYRFNGDLMNDPVIKALAKPAPANVRELWCLVVDKKNIITASNLRANVIWPNAKDLKMPPQYPPVSFIHNYWEHPPFKVDDFDEGIFDDLNDNIQSTQKSSKGLFLAVAIYVLWLFVYQLLPFGRFSHKLVDFVTKKLCGVPNAKSLKIIDAIFWWMKLTGVAKVPFGLELELSSVREHMRKWTSVEAAIRLRMHEEGPSEEIFTSLKSLWRIIIVFSTNFYLDARGQIHALGPKTLMGRKWIPWKRQSTSAKRPHKPEVATAIEIPIHHNQRRPGETLRDLEEDLLKTLAKLSGQLNLEFNAADSETDNNRENLLLLNEIHKSGSNASLFCLLRVCIFSTPSRFSNSSRLVVDFYARKIARLEWLIRDQVTQSWIYQLSRLADELRIAKEIVILQRDIVTKVAESFSAAISAEAVPVLRDVGLIDRPKESRGKDRHAYGQDGRDSLEYRKSTRLTNTLQSKARIQHDNFLADLERLEDTTERLKRQAALLLEIRAEGQNTAIFIFTIVTVVFLPLSFVTSYFGMNTSDIRDMEQGQWIFWASVDGGLLDTLRDSKITRVENVSYPAIQLSSYPAIQLSSYPAIQLSSYPATQLSSYPATQLPSYPAIQLSSYPAIPIIIIYFAEVENQETYRVISLKYRAKIWHDIIILSKTLQFLQNS
ncbi:hypothetical protein F5Y19DRAFT_475934 [Xylariaceae sp. FL1651]|nr:hypothetical protein F5Y19DRAFT_475934 [Xylariaceae sp. FL1651]